MRRRVLVLDIETKADEAFTQRTEFVEQLRAGISAPSNWKDEDKIRIEEDRQLDAALAKLALSPMGGRVYTIGMGWIDNDEVVTAGDEDEGVLLRHFAEALPESPAVICGYNVRRFDVPFLTIRCGINRVELPPWWPQPSDYRRIADIMDITNPSVCGWKGKLGEWLARFGLPPKSAEGSEVENMTLAEAVEYVGNDVRRERELARVLAWAMPAIRGATEMEEGPA